MKKFITLIFSLLLLFALCSCEFPSHSGGSSGSSTGGDVDPDPVPVLNEDGVLEKIKDLLQIKYGVVTLTVKTTQNNLTLTDEYVVTYGTDFNEVSYSVMKANKIIVNDGVITLPDKEYDILKGKVKVFKDGTVEKTEGDDVERDFSAISDVTLDFTKTNFCNATFSETKYKGDVQNPTAFFGNDSLVASDCKIDATFNDSAISTIKIDYLNADGGTVKITYSFTK